MVTEGLSRKFKWYIMVYDVFSISIVYTVGNISPFMDVFADVQLRRFSFSPALSLVVGWSKFCFRVNTPYR